MTAFFCVFILITLLECAVHATLRELHTTDELQKFKVQDLPVGVFYYQNKDNKHLTSKLVDVIESSAYYFDDGSEFMEFGMINCLESGVDALKIDECSMNKRVYYAYSKNEKQKFDLRTLYDSSAFIANMLMFIFGDRIGIIQNAKDWKYEQEQAISLQKDIILSYILGVGDKNHFYLMTYAVNHLEEYRFAFTTEKSFTVELGIPEHSIGSITYAKCSKVSAIPCPVHFVTGKTDTSGAITNLILSQSVPFVSLLNEDGSTVYGDLSDINVVWLFVDNDEDITTYQTIMSSIAEKFTEEGVFIRAIIADRRKHKDRLNQYGVYETTFLPLPLMELAIVHRQSHERQFEIFPPDSEITYKNIEKFIKDVTSSPKSYDSTIADIFDIESISLSDWEQPSSLSKQKLLTMACSVDETYLAACKEFNSIYRRIVRTLDAANLVDIRFMYVDHTGKPKSSVVNKIPSMRFYLLGQKESVFQQGDVPTYEKALSWINSQLGVTLNPLPVSGSDFVSMTTHRDIDVNKVNLLGQDELLNELQDDEISKDAQQARKKFYEDNIVKLTDKTFNATVAKVDFVVVFFYVPWDDRSHMFAKEYAALPTKLVNSKSMLGAKFYKVNCHSEFSTCIQEKTLVYPLIKIYKNGSYLADYKGILDQKSILKSLVLYNEPSLTKLDDEIVSETLLKELSLTYCTAVVVAYFTKEQSEEHAIFKEFSASNHGRYYFTYVTSAKAKNARFSVIDLVSCEIIKVYMSDDRWDSKRELDDVFTLLAINKFLVQASLPYFGELTPYNFPQYKSLGKPFLVIFTDGETAYTSDVTLAMEGLFRENKLNHYSLIWMNTELTVTKTIRRSYLGQRSFNQQELVSVNHNKGEVFLFEQQPSVDASLQELILSWISGCENNDVTPTSYLNNPKWKPIREGFNYLHFIENGVPEDNEGEENDETGNYGHYKPADRSVFHGVKAPKNSKQPHSEESLSETIPEVVSKRDEL